MSTEITAAVKRNYTGLVNAVVALLMEARRHSARSVDAIMTTAYWEIGRRIVGHEQRGKRRAGYGEALVERLADDLTARFGRGFSRRNLFQMREFYSAWPIMQPPSSQLEDHQPSPSEARKVQTLSAESGGWPCRQNTACRGRWPGRCYRSNRGQGDVAAIEPAGLRCMPHKFVQALLSPILPVSSSGCEPMNIDPVPNLHLGTSSWSAESWVGSFYLPGTPPADFLPIYATHYSTVEIDSTYYRIPSLKMVQGWRDRTPPGFIFPTKFSGDARRCGFSAVSCRS